MQKGKVESAGRRPIRRTGRVISTAVMMGLAGCRFVPGPVSVDARNSTHDSKPQSVKPGINDAYRKPDFEIDTWLGRFESESREIFKHRERIVDSLGIQKGMVLADVGAGTGLFTPLFSEAVGPSGTVLAVDITPGFLEHIRARASKHGLHNVQTVLCAEDSVRLPSRSVDLVFVCDTYHHFEYPQRSLSSIYRALKRGGRLIVVDFDRIPDKSREWVLDHVRAGRDTVTQEIIAAGFTLLSRQPDDSFLEENYIVVFRK